MLNPRGGAERERGKGETMDDLISRQAAINALERTAREMFNLSDEFNHYLAGLMDGEMAIRQLPSAQPEIIRCKDCKWWGYEDDTGNVRVCHAAKHGHISSHWEIIIYRTYRGDFYCADAERRRG